MCGRGPAYLPGFSDCLRLHSRRFLFWGQEGLKRFLLSILLISTLSVASFAASVSVTTVTLQTKYGSLTNVYFETASGPSGSTPNTNTALTPSGSSGSYAVSNGATAYLWSPQFTSATSVSAGNWVLDLWASASSGGGTFGDASIESSSEALGRAPSPPAGVVAYVPVTLVNSQTSPVAAGTQVMLTVNWSGYSSYLAANLQNVGFFDASWSPLYSWLESGNSSASTSSVVWVELSSSIPAGGCSTAYMGFYPLSTNNFNAAGYLGEAPTLSPSYGQYDNGNLTFSFYDNFAGTTLSRAWYTTGAVGYYSVNNGLTVNPYSVAGYAFTLVNPYAGPLALDAYQMGSNGAWIGLSYCNIQTDTVSYTVTSGAAQQIYPPQGSDGFYSLVIPGVAPPSPPAPPPPCSR